MTNKNLKSQPQKFIDKARELECDEDEAAFEAKLKSIVGKKPKPRTNNPGLLKKRTRRLSGRSNG